MLRFRRTIVVQTSAIGNIFLAVEYQRWMRPLGAGFRVVIEEEQDKATK